VSRILSSTVIIILVNLCYILFSPLDYSFAQSDKLIQPSDMVYQGAFRLPSGDYGTLPYSNFQYGGTAPAYNPTNDSLYIVSHAYSQLTAEVTIPAAVNSSDLSSLNTADIVQQFYDGLEGRLDLINPYDVSSVNGNLIGGQLVYNGLLYLSAYTYYDTGPNQTTSHFSRPLNLSATGQVKGPVKVGSVIPGFVGGYMALIPQEWQAALGAAAITGQCCLSIISRTSYGPAAFAFNPNDIGSGSPVLATPLVYYPGDHTTLGNWGVEGGLFNGTMTIGGVVIPAGSRSVLFIGAAADTFCYGIGTTDPGLDGTTDPEGVEYCYDPTNPGTKGVHGYPYRYKVYAYDINDLISVKSGIKQPWEVIPYTHWELTLPFRNDNNPIEINGVAYDPETQRVFISHAFADGSVPLIQVYTINVVSEITKPAAPGGLIVR
jgi:hypothetical protein